MVMPTNRNNGYYPDRSHIENCLRASPEPASFMRCPASTPLQTHRPLRQQIPESLTFVSLDFSKVKSFPKSHPHRGPKGFRVITNRNLRTENLARRKNFEYYYVDKAFQNRLAAHSNSTWLKSLVSQPVREIFGKYRRHGEMMDDPLQVPRSYSTPGERAIHDGWDSNSKHGRRENSAFSLSTKYEASTQVTNSPQLTIITRSCTQVITPHTANESNADLVQHRLSPNLGDSPEAEEESEIHPSPQATPRVTPVKREPISEIRLPTGYSPLIDESIYANFERKDMRLPDINSTKSTATHSTNKGRKIFFDGNRNSYNAGQNTNHNGHRSTYKKQQTLNGITENMYNL